MSDEIIGGYRLLKHLVTGQTSQVWEVVETSSHRHFAMKLLLPEKAADAQFRKFLIHEASVGLKLAHPNIIRIVTVEKSTTNPYFVMEFFPGGSLKLRMMRAQKEPKEAEWLREQTQDIFKQWATALAFMNAKGWIHRDVKPDNVLVASSGDVRLIDFALAQQPPTGLAKLFTRKQKAMGTRSYMSPEQIRGAILDRRADIYCFGASVYEVITGRPPFRASSSQELLTKHITEKPQSPQQINPAVSKDFAELVLKMLAKKKEDRPKDFHEVLMTMRQMKVYQPMAAK